ncbi:amidohydrolase [Pseudofulvibacter geojedonensis]|uniref:Amidohydrolase n=1 Tax=Pseudofulvibacter geojedonensis TaxID=1123758 RepID=A0ABW3I084_9FLAO
MQDLNITLIQSNLVWENPIQNRLNFEAKINSISEKTDLIVLPEMFTTGFTMYPKSLAENMDEDSVEWMKVLAKKKQAAICGSLIIKEDHKYYNRYLFITPDGRTEQYNKRHLFTLAGEQHQYTAGTKQTLIEYKGWKIFPQVCYDLRFPVWSRNTYNYDLLVYVANWPKQRIEAWDTLLKARAIENMCYTIGVNRVGIDPNGNEYSGNSAALNYLGKNMCNIQSGQESVSTITLNKQELDSARKKFGFLNDKDSFIVT